MALMVVCYMYLNKWRTEDFSSKAQGVIPIQNELMEKTNF